MSDKGVGAAIGYMERVGFQNVTLANKGGNVVLGTLDEDGEHLMVAVIVDEKAKGEGGWDEGVYLGSFGDLAKGGLRFDRGDVILIRQIAEEQALLRHRSGIWPGEE